MAFAKLKALLRKAGARTVEELQVITSALDALLALQPTGVRTL
jgi:hypothetical protein